MTNGRYKTYNIRLLISYLNGISNSRVDDRSQTPTLDNPRGERNCLGLVGMQLLQCGNDGFFGMQKYLSESQETMSFTFILLFVNTLQKEKANSELDMYFISWDADLTRKQRIFQMPDGQGERSVHEFTNSILNVFDLDQYFPEVILVILMTIASSGFLFQLL